VTAPAPADVLTGHHQQAESGTPVTALKIRPVQAGAVAWIIGTIQFFAAQFIAQSAWRTPYS
jgi:hypothetical protein